MCDHSIEKRKFVAYQYREAIENKTVTCGCGHIIPTANSYRCYYCGEFYCFQCAAVHFGMTREEYRQIKREKEK